MKKARHTEEQIAFALKQAQTGTSVAEVIRRMGISEQTFYRWIKVYGGCRQSNCAGRFEDEFMPRSPALRQANGLVPGIKPSDPQH